VYEHGRPRAIKRLIISAWRYERKIGQLCTLRLCALEPNSFGVNLPNPAYAPQPNYRFNADANTGHGFAILLASVGALRATRSGAG
jgi:hypothetical protein